MLSILVTLTRPGLALFIHTSNPIDFFNQTACESKSNEVLALRTVNKVVGLSII